MLSENEKFFLETKIWKHCKIDIIKMAPRNGQRFQARIFYKKPANDENSSQGSALGSQSHGNDRDRFLKIQNEFFQRIQNEFFLEICRIIFVSFIFTLCCIV